MAVLVVAYAGIGSPKRQLRCLRGIPEAGLRPAAVWDVLANTAGALYALCIHFCDLQKIAYFVFSTQV